MDLLYTNTLEISSVEFSKALIGNCFFNPNNAIEIVRIRRRSATGKALQ